MKSACFQGRTSFAKTSYCKDCAAENNRRFRERKTQCSRCKAPLPPGRQSVWCAECCRRRARDYHRLSTYGVEPAQYAELLAQQEGVCAICRQPETIRDRTGRVASLAVDHDHSTGEVRGLLCRACNAGIGNLKDSPDLLRAALSYLEDHAILPCDPKAEGWGS